MKDLSDHGIVALVRNDNNEFLLLEDSREPMQGYWAPPHGRCESSDETEEAGVEREVLEETGITVIPLRKVHTQSADTKVKTVSFWLVKASGFDVTLDSESSNYGWFTLDEAQNLKLYPGTKSFIELVMNGVVSLDI